MHPHLEADLYTSDEVYYSTRISAVVTIGGETVFIVRDYEEYLELKRAVTVTHRIRAIVECGGMLRYVMTGSDGSEITIHLTMEDAIYNLRFAESVLSIKRLDLIG